MGFKDLFINKDENDTGNIPDSKSQSGNSQNVNSQSNSGMKFPNSTDTKSNSLDDSNVNFVSATSTAKGTNPFLEKTMEMYDSGFNKLNQPGYDFFEFCKSVIKGGIDNPQIYEMALEVATAMDSSVTKQSLMDQSDFYVNEILKVHAGYTSEGKAKRDNLTKQKEAENASLVTDLDSLRKQVESIQRQIRTKENELAEIGNKYQPAITEIDYKLEANDIAKDKYIALINHVKSNIKNNLK